MGIESGVLQHSFVDIARPTVCGSSKGGNLLDEKTHDVGEPAHQLRNKIHQRTDVQRGSEDRQRLRMKQTVKVWCHGAECQYGY